MATLEPVHVLEMDRATTRMECVKINPTRTYGVRTDYGTAFFTWQNGKWFGLGGGEIDPAIVPEAYRQDIATNRPMIDETGPAVVVTCEFCGETMNRANKDQHLVWHVRNAMAEAGTTRPGPAGGAAVADIPPPTTLPPSPPAAPPARPTVRPGSRPDAV